jgi:Uma2 family endonuclease
MVMVTVVNEDEQVQVPSWVVDLESFRRWVESDEFPENGRICFLNGEVWVDMSKEQLFSHNQVKYEIFLGLGNLIKGNRLGRFFPDGARLTSVTTSFSVVPEGVFVSKESLDTERVRLVKGKRGGFVELEGTPDMVLEVVSASSVAKDTDVLLDLYWKAGIPEYWLIDARRTPLEFDIYRHASKGYTPTRKQGGWLKSNVFGKAFKLSQQSDERGHPEYTLEMR